MPRHRNLSTVLVAASVSLGVALSIGALGCGTPKRMTPDEYYKEGTAAFEDENYPVAITQYNELLDQFPFDPHAEEAELKIAEAHYKREAYPEAIAALSDFQRMHPMSPHLARVYYLLGESYMDQMVTIDRDQGASDNAHSWYQVVIDRYPNSSYADESREKLADCRESLAGHELYVARFYYNRGNTDAAENRVKGILENYPDTEIATTALERLAAEYERTGETERAEVVHRAIRLRLDRPALDGTLTLNSDAGQALLADLDARYGPNLPPGKEEEVSVLKEPIDSGSAPIIEPAPAPGIDRGSRAL